MCHFHTKLQYQKPMLRQIEWWVQNGPITKNRVLPVTTLPFWKFSFSLRTSCKELIWCTSYTYAHTPAYCKRWGFIWWCFFPMSILKYSRNVKMSCTFNSDWMDKCLNLHFCFWIGPIKNSPNKGMCCVCKKTFPRSSTGENVV